MELTAAPDGLADAEGAHRFGAYEGCLRTSRLDGLAPPFARRGPRRLLAEKRWRYVCVATPDLVVTAAIVELGYLASGFAYLFDRRERRLAEHEALVPPLFACVDDAPQGGAWLRSLRTTLRLDAARGGGRMVLAWPGAAVDLALAIEAGPPALTAVCPVGEDRVTMTQKSTCVPAEGEVRLGSRRWAVKDALASLDFSHGFLLRETRWRWASASGRTREGRTVGLNLVEGHNDGAVTENAVWVDGKLWPLGRVRFEFDRARPGAPWRIEAEGGAVALRFEPEAVRRKDRDLGLIASQYAQPIGRFSGTVRAGGETLQLQDLVGVTEDHRSVW